MRGETRRIPGPALRARRSLVVLASFALTVCGDARPPELAPGVSRELARERARRISNLRYGLTFAIPSSLDRPVLGRAVLRFDLEQPGRGLAIDFTHPGESVRSLVVNGESTSPTVRAEHIWLMGSRLQTGPNRVEIEFVAGDLSLNRNPEYLYTLFVPDRARYAFPCFDQPDLKARFDLTLEIPPDWVAVANGPAVSRETEGGRVVYRFGTTPPISTYLFAFAAGAFRVETAGRAGRTLSMYHRETDTAKVARNLEAIFDLHATALDWLQEYTGIGYPFDKFDFVLIPSFQYNGMEHPGSIFYRASRLFLDESATQSDYLRRASLIAHETAHIWFGDLVTMEWFNDVWMKEVFANFMAARIVHPSFPEIDHDLRFLLAHYPTAYEVDRTAGANPIRQELENLEEAGTLYGAIIYQKAPIVMEHLERRVGTDTMREGLREYLRTYSFDNAGWRDLITILDRRSPQDLPAWSRTWVEEADRPEIGTELRLAPDGAIASLRLRQVDPDGRGRLWRQRLHVRLSYPDGSRLLPVDLDVTTVEVQAARGLPAPEFILPNGRGLGYGLFLLDPASRDHLTEDLPTIEDPMVRAIAWLDLWDVMLEGEMSPERILDLALRALPRETEEQNIERVLGYLEEVYWRYLPDAVRHEAAPRVEGALWTLLHEAGSTSLKAAYFDSYRTVAATPTAIDTLRAVWEGDRAIDGLPLSEEDLTALALALAVREPADWDEILAEQARQIQNPDRADRFTFVRPAVAADPAVRDSFFQSLRDPGNREHEPWVLDALSYLHHPLRAERSERYLRPGLEMLQEIQRTGDIFFPKGWLDATLGGHSSARAATTVCDFLRERPDYPSRLRQKILQSADPLFRAAAILHGGPNRPCE